jgi:CRP-like cAMP-binding protein
MEYASFLRRHIEEIVTLTDEEFDQVSAYFVPLAVDKKTLLIKTGQRVISEYLVVKGCLKTFAMDEAGNEFITQFATENWWVSDYPAYIQKTPAELNVQALENSYVLRTTLEHRQAMSNKVPKMHIFNGQKH